MLSAEFLRLGSLVLLQCNIGLVSYIVIHSDSVLSARQRAMEQCVKCSPGVVFESECIVCNKLSLS